MRLSRTLFTYDAFGLATRKRFRGAADTIMVAPDQTTSVVRCAPSFCWKTVEQYQVTTVQDGAPTTVQRFDVMTQRKPAQVILT